MIVAWNSCLTGLYSFLSDPELALHQFYSGSGLGFCFRGLGLLFSWALLRLPWFARCLLLHCLCLYLQLAPTAPGLPGLDQQ
ncbi:hypothetical protein BDV10DRAFT_173480 [Aspergillus recurvatus]